MKKKIKRACVLVAALFLASLVGTAAHHGAYAGGGIDYETRVTSDLEENICYITLWVSKVINDEYETKMLRPGESYTFHSGALCPSGLEVTVQRASGGAIKTTTFYVHILGHEVGDWLSFSACCWGTSWRLVQMGEGTNYKLQKE